MMVSPETLQIELKETADFLNNLLKGNQVTTAVTLGSGLGDFADDLEDKIEIPYQDIPHFHGTSVVGHAGKLVYGKIKGKVSVLAMQGRIHAYEGHSFSEVVFPTRVLKFLGVKNLILTNASGGMNPKFQAGDLVLIKDHLNLTGNNPLLGKNPDFLGPRFPDMTHTYNPELSEGIRKAAKNISYNLKDGVYVGVLGPSYETPSEIKMYQTLGGDMVGMSTVAEAIAGHHCGLKIAGISCITNMAAGLGTQELDHADIKEEANRVKGTFISLLNETILGLK
ncbi:MAG: purine-nucleoside phosphorylase [Bacteriovoracaceae bacterium]|nr:purine-nucleoside phosphorylase [Bacteriovoracaceae bacterium]